MDFEHYHGWVNMWTVRLKSEKGDYVLYKNERDKSKAVALAFILVDTKKEREELYKFLTYPDMKYWVSDDNYVVISQE